jgi:uncharacterized membrane protein YoaT (DUF817 family)
MHANDVFLFFKNYFSHQYIKTIQKVQTALNFSKKKKKFKFGPNELQTKRSFILSPLCFFFYFSHEKTPFTGVRMCI